MNSTLLESLWARVSANIGDRIERINGLLTQALSANTESIAARDGAVSATGDAATSESKAASSEVAAKQAEHGGPIFIQTLSASEIVTFEAYNNRATPAIVSATFTYAVLA